MPGGECPRLLVAQLSSGTRSEFGSAHIAPIAELNFHTRRNSGTEQDLYPVVPFDLFDRVSVLGPPDQPSTLLFQPQSGRRAMRLRQITSTARVPDRLKQEISQLRPLKTRSPDQLATELTKRRDTRFRFSRPENGPGRTACRSISINLGMGPGERTAEGSRWTIAGYSPPLTARFHTLLHPMPVRSAGIVPPCYARTAGPVPVRHRDSRQPGATRRGHWQSRAAYQ